MGRARRTALALLSCSVGVRLRLSLYSFPLLRNSLEDMSRLLKNFVASLGSRVDRHHSL